VSNGDARFRRAPYFSALITAVAVSQAVEGKISEHAARGVRGLEPRLPHRGCAWRLKNMNKQIVFSAVVLSVLMQPAPANPVSRRATITGGGGNGRCSIEVSVDHAAEVEISGDTGFLTTTAGQPAAWRLFQCNVPMPRNPVDFRFGRTNGRGTVRLTQDPRSTGGRTVVQITDPQGGRAIYSFDLQWRGPRDGGGGFPMARAIQICQDSVTNRLNRDGYSYVTFERTIPDDNPGRNDWVNGRASAKRGFETTRFWFSCSVDFRSGRVRSVDVNRR
jgi:hypothetical protein